MELCETSQLCRRSARPYSFALVKTTPDPEIAFPTLTSALAIADDTTGSLDLAISVQKVWGVWLGQVLLHAIEIAVQSGCTSHFS